ncbi:hypothetical protein QVD99_003364 [Batrachochytrium dendrobatidis]|nr:hypothetical protein O5D80_008645 [Batrachochytrium dendrobatidis]KAK5670177.1 hypothetical protein QVD99_003364 [Batrachochytrium dendrobatidis]
MGPSGPGSIISILFSLNGRVGSSNWKPEVRIRELLPDIKSFLGMEGPEGHLVSRERPLIGTPSTLWVRSDSTFR